MADHAIGVTKFLCVQRSSAVVALVSSCVFKAAIRADPFDESIRKKALIDIAVMDSLRLSKNEPIRIDLRVMLLNEPLVDRRFCPSIIVV